MISLLLFILWMLTWSFCTMFFHSTIHYLVLLPWGPQHFYLWHLYLLLLFLNKNWVIRCDNIGLFTCSFLLHLLLYMLLFFILFHRVSSFLSVIHDWLEILQTCLYHLYLFKMIHSFSSIRLYFSLHFVHLLFLLLYSSHYWLRRCFFLKVLYLKF